jgi:ribonuclease G
LKERKEKNVSLLVHPYLEAYFINGIISRQMKWLFKYKKWVSVRGITDNRLLEHKFVNKNNEEITL